MQDFKIPDDVSFLKLKLKKNKRNNRIVFNRKQLIKICLYNGANPKFLNSLNIIESSLIFILYTIHIENGGMENKVAEGIVKNLLEIQGFKTPTYQKIEFAEPGSPNENSRLLLEHHTDGHALLKKIDRNQYELLGRLMATILLIEYKLENLLIKFDKKIRDKTLGHKIKVFEDFLNVFNPDEEDVEYYYGVIPSFKELNNLRNKIAHNLNKISFSIEDIPIISKYLEDKPHSVIDATSELNDAATKSLAYIAAFTLELSEVFAHLRIQLK